MYNWKTRKADWEKIYWNGQEHYHRKQIIEALREFYPFESVLEVGCNCGPNLNLIKQSFPGVKLAGIDINESAIKTGRRLLPEADLRVGDAEKIDFPDQSFDIVLTDACLIYTDLRKAFSEIDRIARKGIVLSEQWNKDVKIIKIEQWEDKTWEKYGYIIKIKK